MIFADPADVIMSTTGCCIRFGASGIYLHHNPAHWSVGVAGDEALSLDSEGRLVVKHRAIGTLVTMGALPDETLTARGISIGGSGGTGTTKLQLAAHGEPLNLNWKSHYAQVAGEYANAWLFWQHARLSPAAT